MIVCQKEDHTLDGTIMLCKLKAQLNLDEMKKELIHYVVLTSDLGKMTMTELVNCWSKTVKAYVTMA